MRTSTRIANRETVTRPASDPSQRTAGARGKGVCPFALVALLLALAGGSPMRVAAAEPDTILNLWPGQSPGEPLQVGPEQDFTKPQDRLIAGRPIIKLGNVATPQIHVFLPPSDKRNGAAVVICPGGGFSILAWDLEGTEVADWLNSIGVAGIVLKYRVPTRDQNPRWLAGVQDAQRAMSLVRTKAASWDIDPERVGILGFSAGGATAALTAVFLEQRKYERIDSTDDLSCRPDFAVPVYPGALLTEDNSTLGEFIRVTSRTPPMFLVHAFDDGVRIENSVLLFLALKKAGVASELHVYDAGGHGYGLRAQAGLPVTSWPNRCAEWLARGGWLGAKP